MHELVPGDPDDHEAGSCQLEVPPPIRLRVDQRGVVTSAIGLDDHPVVLELVN